MPALRLGSAMLCLVMGASACWAQMDDQDTAEKKYEAYRAKVVAGDLNIDWRDFRLSAALGQVSHGFDSQPVHNQFVDDLNAGRYEKALAGAQIDIDHNMADGEGHLLAMTALRKMGKEQEARKEEAILNAIGQSITQSGDGNSPETALFTVMPSESVFFLTEGLGAEIEEHEFVVANGHAFDKLTVLDRKGARRVLWFNTDTNELLKARAKRWHDAQQKAVDGSSASR